MSGTSSIDGWIAKIDAFTEKTRLSTLAAKVEREVRARRLKVASERAAIVTAFETLRPDGRPTFDAAYLAVAQVIGAMGDCSRRAIGAVFVRDDVPLAWGYNGADPGAPGCLSGACPRAESSTPEYGAYDNCIARHAEINAIGFAAHRGISLADATLYVSAEPCHGCYKALASARIVRIIWPGRLTALADA